MEFKMVYPGCYSTSMPNINATAYLTQVPGDYANFVVSIIDADGTESEGPVITANLKLAMDYADRFLSRLGCFTN